MTFSSSGTTAFALSVLNSTSSQITGQVIAPAYNTGSTFTYSTDGTPQGSNTSFNPIPYGLSGQAGSQIANNISPFPPENGYMAVAATAPASNVNLTNGLAPY